MQDKEVKGKKDDYVSVEQKVGRKLVHLFILQCPVYMHL